MTTGLTKQGVRNLDALPAKPAGKRLEAPPLQSQVCRHPMDRVGRIWVNGDTYCRDCGQIWDWNGLPY